MADTLERTVEKTDEKTAEDTDLGTLVAPDHPWITIVWNDPVNLMNYVAYVFKSYFGFSSAKANKLMMQVHKEGKAVVAWLDDSGVRFLFDTTCIAKLPEMTWSEVFGRLNRRLKCDDRLILDQLSEYVKPQQLLVARLRPKSDSPNNFRNGRIADYNYQAPTSMFLGGRQQQP